MKYVVPMSVPTRARRLVKASRSAWTRATVLAAVGLLYSSAAFATSGSSMPWNAPLQSLLNNLTGPTARVVVGIAIALTGLVWMMKRHEEGAGRLGQAVVGGGLLFGAQMFVGSVGFTGSIL